MSRDTRSLLLLTLFCTLAAAFFGFGTIAFSFQSAYNGSGREPLLFLTREIVYVVLAVVLVMRGGWRGVLASIGMTIGATTLEWLLFPATYTWAGIGDPEGYAARFPDFERPSYTSWATLDVAGVGVASALAQVLRLMARVDPKAPPDE